MFLALMLMAFCGSSTWAQNIVNNMLTIKELGINTGYRNYKSVDGLVVSYATNATFISNALIQMRGSKNSGLVVTASNAKAKK